MSGREWIDESLDGAHEFRACLLVAATTLALLCMVAAGIMVLTIIEQGHL